jgi:hypothetical protein
MKSRAVIRILDQAEVLRAFRNQAGIELMVMNDSHVLDLLICSDGEVDFYITLINGRGTRDDSLAAAG